MSADDDDLSIGAEADKALPASAGGLLAMGMPVDVNGQPATAAAQDTAKVSS